MEIVRISEENQKLRSMFEELTRNYTALQNQLVLKMRDHQQQQVNSHWINISHAFNYLNMDRDELWNERKVSTNKWGAWLNWIGLCAFQYSFKSFYNLNQYQP